MTAATQGARHHHCRHGTVLKPTAARFWCSGRNLERFEAGARSGAGGLALCVRHVEILIRAATSRSDSRALLWELLSPSPDDRFTSNCPDSSVPNCMTAHGTDLSFAFAALTFAFLGARAHASEPQFFDRGSIFAVFGLRIGGICMFRHGGEIAMGAVFSI